MKAICLHSQQEIEAFLRRNPFLHLYSLGDLDDFFWPYTTWYALKDQQQITQLALLYTGTSPPTLLGLTEGPVDLMRELLQSILHGAGAPWLLIRTDAAWNCARTKNGATMKNANIFVDVDLTLIEG